MGLHTFQALSLSTGSPQGCVLSPLLYTLYIHDCTPVHHSNTFVKFGDDTAVLGLISRGDEFDYRDEVERLAELCKVNNLLLNTSKTKELILDFRRKKTGIQPLLIGGTRVERVSNFRFLGVNIMENLTWSVHTTELVKKAQQRLYFLRVLRRNNIPRKLLMSFYRCSIERIFYLSRCFALNKDCTQFRCTCYNDNKYILFYSIFCCGIVF